MPLILIVSSLLATTSHANPIYQDRLSKIQNMNRRLDQELKQMGFRPPEPPITVTGALEETESKRPALFQMHDSATRLQAPAGKLLYGEIQNRLVVGPEISPVIIVLASGQNVFSETRALCRARQSGTGGRVQIECDRITLSTGKTLAIKGSVLDQAGAFGVEAETFSSKAWSVAGAMGASFVSGLAASQQTITPNAFGFSQTQPTGRNAVLQGVAQTAADQSKRLIDEATQERPILVVEPRTLVTLYLDEEVRF